MTAIRRSVTLLAAAATAGSAGSERRASAAVAQSSRVKRAGRGMAGSSGTRFWTVPYSIFCTAPYRMRQAMDWLIDELLPGWHFRHRYDREIAAEPAQVWAALHT